LQVKSTGHINGKGTWHETEKSAEKYPFTGTEMESPGVSPGTEFI